MGVKVLLKIKKISVLKELSVRSLHNLGELKDMSEPLDYCFFGPVYESISKKGYIPKISLPELGACLHTLKKAKTKKPLVYALGGVRRRKIPELFNLGFDGVTLLGSIWGKKKTLLLHLKSINMLSEVHGPKKRRKRGYFSDCLRKRILKDE